MASQGGQRSYFAFLRQAKASFGLTQKQAIGAYRAFTEKTGKAPTAKAVKSNAAAVKSAVRTAKTRITKEENRAAREAAERAAQRSAAAKKGAETRAAKKTAEAEKKAKRSAAAKKGAATRAAKKAAGQVGEIRDLDEWEDLAAYMWDDADYEDYHAGVEYESSRKGK